jgi:hypothetical protein
VPPEELFFLVPKLLLGNPIAGQAPAWREKHLFIAAVGPSRSLGKIDVPKQELGNEARAGFKPAPTASQLNGID